MTCIFRMYTALYPPPFRQRACGGGDHQRDVFQSPAQHREVPWPVRHSGMAVSDRQKLLHLLSAQGEADCAARRAAGAGGRQRISGGASYRPRGGPEHSGHPPRLAGAVPGGIHVAGVRRAFLQADRRDLLQDGQLGLCDLPLGQKNDQKQIGGQQP